MNPLVVRNLIGTRGNAPRNVSPVLQALRGTSQPTLIDTGGFQALYDEATYGIAANFGQRHLSSETTEQEDTKTGRVVRSAERQSRFAFLSASGNPVRQQPYLVVNTALTLLVGIFLSVVMLSGGIGVAIEQLISGDQPTLILASTSVVALLCGTMGLRLLADRRERGDRSLPDSIHSEAAESALSALQQEVRDLRNLSEDISDCFGLLSKRERASWHVRRAGLDSWLSIDLSASNLTTISGQDADVRALITRTSRSEGVQDCGSLVELIWLARFRSGSRTLETTHIVEAIEDGDRPVEFERGLLRVLAGYRALESAARKRGESIDLSSVRIVLCDPNLLPQSSILIGLGGLPNEKSKSSSVVVRQPRLKLMSATAMNSSTELNFSLEVVHSYLLIARELIDGANCILSLEEAEARFGYLVPERDSGVTSNAEASNEFEWFGEYFC